MSRTAIDQQTVETTAMQSRNAPSRLAWLAGLLVVWPVLEFVNKNKHEPDFDLSWLLIIVTAAVLTVYSIAALTRLLASERSARQVLVTSSFVLCYFQFYFDLKTFFLDEESSATIVAPFLGSVVVVAVTAWWLARSSGLSDIIGVIAVVLFSYPLFQLLMDHGTTRIDLLSTPREKTVSPATESPAQAPNVYFFVFDAYLRSDMLRKHYGYDNSSFVAALEARGFTVARRSRSNFPTTRYSLNYLLNPSLARGDKTGLVETLRNDSSFLGREVSEVQQEFEARGYSFAMMNHSGETKNACQPNCISTDPLVSFVQVQFLKTTPVYDAVKKYAPGILWSWLSRVPNDHRYALEHMPEGARRPVFLFSHALIPHPPYSVDENCRPVPAGVVDFNLEFKRDWPFLRERYLQQVGCSNKQMLEIADQLQAADPGAIVFFVSDHGWKANHAAQVPGDEDHRRRMQMSMRVANLMALRAPLSCMKFFGDSITLVNAFPFVFACIDGLDPQFVDGSTYYLYGADKNRLQDVTALVTQSEDAQRGFEASAVLPARHLN